MKPKYYICALIVIIAVFVGRRLLSPGITVLLVNDGSGALSNLTLKASGSVNTLEVLPAKSDHSFSPNGDGGSHLEIEFTDSSGARHKELIDIYFESGYRGKVGITIDGSGKVTWKSTIRASI